MTLHEAIRSLLRQKQRPMTTTEIAESINKLGSYVKRDRSPITAFQIHGRTRNYAGLFHQAGSTISLVEWDGLHRQSSPYEPTDHVESPLSVSSTFDPSQLRGLLTSDSFKPAGSIDHVVPQQPGIYAIRVDDRASLPGDFSQLSTQSGHQLLYIGIASQSLHKRFLGQELRARGHGTFFRSIGAVLGYRPEVGSLIGKKNTRNYKFSSVDEHEIIAWINRSLSVNWIEFPTEALHQAETALITEHRPLLNIAGNPAALTQLSALRAECVRIANDHSE